MEWFSGMSAIHLQCVLHLQPFQSPMHVALLSQNTMQLHSSCPWEWEKGLNIFIIAWRTLIIHRAVFLHHGTLSGMWIWSTLGFSLHPASVLDHWCICLFHAFDSQWLISCNVIISLTFILEAWACLKGWQWTIQSYSITDRQFNLLYQNLFVFLYLLLDDLFSNNCICSP